MSKAIKAFREPSAAAGMVLFLAFASLSMVLSAEAYAEAKKPDASAQALRKAQGMLRDLTATVTSLQTEKTALQEQVDKLNGRIKELEALQDQVRQQKSAVDDVSCLISRCGLQHILSFEF